MDSPCISWQDEITLLVVLGPFSYIHPGVGSTEHRTQRHHHHLAQIVAACRPPTRVVKARKGFSQCHLYPREKPRVEPISTEYTRPCHNPMKVNDYFPGSTTAAYAMALTRLPAHPGYYGEMVWILMMLEQWLT